MSKQVFRFKFSKDFVSKMKEFSIENKDKELKQYKKDWELWFVSVEEIYNRELDRITKLGYDGDVKKKVFHSCRYYYGKKENTKKPDVKTRREYIKFNREVLYGMDKHILDNIYDDDYKPSIGYKKYCIQYREQIDRQFKEIISNTDLTEVEIEKKYKKTYNNRYYLMSKNKLKMKE